MWWLFAALIVAVAVFFVLCSLGPELTRFAPSVCPVSCFPSAYHRHQCTHESDALLSDWHHHEKHNGTCLHGASLTVHKLALFTCMLVARNGPFLRSDDQCISRLQELAGARERTPNFGRRLTARLDSEGAVLRAALSRPVPAALGAHGQEPRAHRQRTGATRGEPAGGAVRAGVSMHQAREGVHGAQDGGRPARIALRPRLLLDPEQESARRHPRAFRRAGGESQGFGHVRRANQARLVRACMCLCVGCTANHCWSSCERRDIDDTTYAGSCDARFPEYTIYPGARQFTAEVLRSRSTTSANKGASSEWDAFVASVTPRQCFLTDRPEALKAQMGELLRQSGFSPITGWLAGVNGYLSTSVLRLTSDCVFGWCCSADRQPAERLWVQVGHVHQDRGEPYFAIQLSTRV